MQSSSNISNPDWIRVDMGTPLMLHLCRVLQHGLQQHFAEVAVEMVECPDLRFPPFNFTAPGLQGNAALVEMGSTSNLFPLPNRMKIYHFHDILRTIGRNQYPSLIIGAGHFSSPLYGDLSEVYVNSLYHPILDQRLSIWSRSYVTFFDERKRQHSIGSLDNTFPWCNMQGNFFISNGSPGPVIQVIAKRRIGSMDFVEAIQESLRVEYSYESKPLTLVGLGGTFLVNKAKVRLHIMPNIWPESGIKDKTAVHNWLRYLDADTPVVAVGTMVNTNLWFVPCSRENKKKIWLTRSHFHALSNNGIGGHFYREIASSETVEYLGYFCPTMTLYRFDPMEPYDAVPDFSCVTSCW